MTAGRLPLVVVAPDASDPDLLARWAAEGHRSVMDAGWWGRTAGPDLDIEHEAWVSLLSGRSRAEHGYHYFRQPRPGTYDLDLVRGHDAGAPLLRAALRPGLYASPLASS